MFPLVLEDLSSVCDLFPSVSLVVLEDFKFFVSYIPRASRGLPVAMFFGSLGGANRKLGSAAVVVPTRHRSDMEGDLAVSPRLALGLLGTSDLLCTLRETYPGNPFAMRWLFGGMERRDTADSGSRTEQFPACEWSRRIALGSLG